MLINLQPYEQVDLSQRGKTIVYLAGASELRFETEAGSFQIPAGGQVTLTAVFDKVTVKNMGSVATQSEVLFVEGDYARLSDVSIVQIQGITNTVTTQVSSMPAVDVNSLPPVDIESLPAVDVQSLPPVDIESLPSVDVQSLPPVDIESLPAVDVQSLPRFKGGSTASAKKMLFDATGVLTIPASASRKDLTVLALDTNASTVTFDELDLFAGDSLPFADFIGSIQLSGTEGEGVMVMEISYAA